MFNNLLKSFKLFSFKHPINKYSFLEFVGGFIVLYFFISGLWLFTTTPKDFPARDFFLVSENETLKSISIRLQEENFIHSALFFRAGVSAYGQDRHIKAGQYYFEKPITLFHVVIKFINNPDMPLLKATIPEGSTDEEIAKIITKIIPEINKDDFLESVKKQNVTGMLFPETYFLLPSKSKEEVINLFVKTFKEKYNNYIYENEKYVKDTKMKMQDIDKNTDLFQKNVIILASIIEGEGKDLEDMKIISGILWKRLLSNMALQVDVAKETYKKRGLPSAPINNPGMNAIQAVFEPTLTPYLYYITGNDGKMYYAKSFTEHKNNIAKYLR